MDDPFMEDISTTIRAGMWRSWRFGFLTGLPWGVGLGQLVTALARHLA